MHPETPTFDQIVALVAGELTVEQAALTEESLLQSPSARQLIARVRGLVKMMRSDDSVEPPAPTTAQAMQLMRGPIMTAMAGWMDAARQIVAAAVFDSRQRVALAGYRKTASAAYQLAYEADQITVDLQCSPQPDGAGDRWSITGQLFHGESLGLVNGAMIGVDNTMVIQSMVVDDRGRFHVAVPAGTYDLLFSLPDAALCIPNIEIG